MSNYFIYALIALFCVILLWVIITSLNSHNKLPRVLSTLNSYMTEELRCPKLEKGGIVRVYVSGGMFNLSDTLYSVGPDGLKPGLDYQSINLVDMICSFSDEQWEELRQLCTLWDVPWYGVVGEIEKIGWECFCPVRDGITMATVAAAISVCTKDQVLSEDSSSIFYLDNIKKDLKKSDPSDEEIIYWARSTMNGALGTNVGANDLYNMYSCCNACILNYNGIQADAGAIAEVGQLGARGVPTVIIKGSLTGDFSGISNPMPVMATTSSYTLLPNLTNNPGSVYNGAEGALPWLKNKVDLLINADIEDDPLTYGNYNHDAPLPPLQIFWAELGSKVFFLKHKSKSIQTLSNGKTNFSEDYTDFWYNNVVKGGTAGLVLVAKAMADNLAVFLANPKFRNIKKYWA